MSQSIDVKVPDIGDFTGVPVIDVLVKEGEAIEVDTPLITLETEKATLDVPSSAAGTVSALKVQKGAKVSKGDVILTLEAAAAEQPAGKEAGAEEADAKQPDAEPEKEAAPPESSAKPAQEARSESPPRQPASSEKPPSAEGATAYAGPAVRRLARELGVDLTAVQGSGKRNRITPEDVKAFVKRALSATRKTPAPAAVGASGLPKLPVVDFSKYGPVEIQPLSRIQRISGPRLHASWVNLPHVTQFDAADITDLEQTRAKLKDKAAGEGIKLTPLAFVIRACARTLREFPQFNVSLDESGVNIVVKKYLHIGFAADTPQGLMVPVIRDADRKDVYELARELGELSARARDGKLTSAQMQGGCFTVSSLGSIGGTAFTPIINPPEVAILGVSRAEHRPVYQDGGFVPRLMLPLSLSYDHRVVDGVLGVRFTTHLAKELADVRGLLEAIP